LIAVSKIDLGHDDHWLRTARQVLINRPGAVGLIPVGADVDTTAVCRRLAQAMGRLTGQPIGVFPHWRTWRETAGVAEVIRAANSSVVVLSPLAETDPVVAATVLETAVAHARINFAHLVVDLAGLPLRHPATLACADVLVTVAASGGVREEHLLALERTLPGDRNLGVVLID
jgi:hypothetical protein